MSDISIPIWGKFLFICAYSGVTSLMRLPIGRIVGDPDAFSLFEKCMGEILALAKAKGVRLPPGIVQEKLDFAKGLEPNSTSSMQRDFEAGRRTELSSLNGTVSRMGKALGVATPINDFIYASLKLHDPGSAV